MIQVLFNCWLQGCKVIFFIKDLGYLHYFSGIVVSKTDCGMHVNQQKYIQQLLEMTQLHETKPVPTPMSPWTTLSKSDGQLQEDSKKFKSLVVAL